MRKNDLSDQCSKCKNVKPWSLDIGGNHGCMCMEHQLHHFYKKTNDCPKFQQEQASFCKNYGPYCYNAMTCPCMMYERYEIE